jgi:hypothetical protein
MHMNHFQILRVFIAFAPPIQPNGEVVGLVTHLRRVNVGQDVGMMAGHHPARVVE